MKKSKSRFRNSFKKFFLIDDTPHKIAGGAALGIFAGIVPGEGVLTTLFLAYIFRLNRLSAMAGLLITNMWTTLLVLPLAAITGGFIFRIDLNTLSESFQKNYQLGWKSFLDQAIFSSVALPLLVGFLVVGGVIALIGYFIIYFILKTKKISLHDKL